MSTLNNLPAPPPGAHPVQLELWRRVIQRRYKQIETMSPSTFSSFAIDVASDYTKSVMLESSQMDLTKSHYSSFLLPRYDAAAPVDYDCTAKQIAFHLLGLFYTAIDERMPPPERQFAIDIVKRAFSLLDDTMKEIDKNEGVDYVVGKHGRDEEEEEDDDETIEDLAVEMPKKKHARKDPPRIEDAINNDDGQHDNKGDTQNMQSDRSKEEGECVREKTSVSRIGADEGGETVASSGPSVSTSKHNESDEGAANEMDIDGSIGLGTATHNNDGEVGGGEKNQGRHRTSLDLLCRLIIKLIVVLMIMIQRRNRLLILPARKGENLLKKMFLPMTM